MIKHPKKLLAIIDSPDAIKSQLEKLMKKSDTAQYYLSKYTKSILELKGADYFHHVCIDNAYPKEHLETMAQIALDIYFKNQDTVSINYLLGKGFKAKHMVYKFSLYLKEAKCPEMMSLFREHDWSGEDKISYSTVHGEKNMDIFINTLEPLALDEIQHIFKTNFCYCNDAMIDKILQKGASVYPDGVFNRSFLRERLYFPPNNSTYIGDVTLRGRRNITRLLKDKSPDNADWMEFLTRSFDSDNSEVRIHMRELIVAGDLTPQHNVDNKKFWQLFCGLEDNAMKSCLESYRQKPIIIDENLIIKSFMQFNPQAIIVLIEDGFDFDKFLKSTLVKSIREKTGFTKKIDDWDLQDMQEGLSVIDNFTRFKKLGMLLDEKCSSSRKNKI